jgi:hypothetical protein
MWKYDTPILLFCFVESRRLAGQGFASSIARISAFFPVSRQSKWQANLLGFFAAGSSFQRPLSHILERAGSVASDFGWFYP